MDTVLLVSDRDNWSEPFARLLTDQFPVKITFAGSSAEGREFLNVETYALVLILAPLKTDSGLYLARKAAQTDSGVILACPATYLSQYEEKLSEEGIFLFGMDRGRRMFLDAARLMFSLHRRLLKARKPETSRYQDQIREIRAVDRAKCLLIQYQQMTEKEAHHYIERRAMDRRCGKKEVAEEILRIYDLE